MSEQSVPRWQKLTALGLALLIAGLVVAFWGRLGADFLPPDRSTVGPNLVAAFVQGVVVFIAVVLLWPPTRRRIHNFVDQKLVGVHSRLDALHARHDEHAKHLDRIGRSLRDLHEKIDARTNDPPDPPAAV
jgi:hypothetical protein